MKHYLLPALLLVSGCQSTLNTEDTQQEKSQNIEAASVEEINYALLHDESIDVYHPVADVDFSLKKDAITRHDDIWQRIRDQLQ